MGERLGKQDWIHAGLRATAKQGVEAVRVESLAKALDVTKGSFYWHFEDRNALLRALLAEWERVATNDIIAEVDGRGGDAGARLRALFTIVLQSDGRLDRAVRAWAAKDAAAAAALARVDRRRLSYLQSLFKGLGFDPRQAKARARLVYHALMGEFTMGVRTNQRERLVEQLEIIYPMLVRGA